MAGNNATVARSAIAEYKKYINSEIERGCRRLCEYLCLQAIKERKTNPLAHDFTGNLITSIVVCMYKNKVAQDAWYAAQYEKKAIRIKMRQRPVKKWYNFPVDYSGAQNTKYKVPKDSPNVEGRYGVDDAKAFFHSYKPPGNHAYDIVIAYPVEYAEWVETERATTGFMQTYEWAKSVGISYLKLEK